MQKNKNKTTNPQHNPQIHENTSFLGFPVDLWSPVEPCGPPTVGTWHDSMPWALWDHLSFIKSSGAWWPRSPSCENTTCSSQGIGHTRQAGGKANATRRGPYQKE